MNTHEEKPFTINGIKSPVHCITMHRKPTDKEYRLSYHYHKYIEFLYSIDSEAFVWINGEQYIFNTGDLVMISSGESHDLTFLKTSTYIVLKFSPEIIYSTEQTIFEYKYILPFILKNNKQKVFNEIYKTDIPKLIDEIMLEWTNKNYGYEIIVRSNLLKIYSYVIRFWNSGNQLSSITDETVSDDMKNAIAYIADNFTVADEKSAAKISNMSYNYFSYKFKTYTGCNFNEYIMSLKISYAERLLMTTDRSITDIAYTCGFSSLSHFIARFRAAKGVTPLKYRKLQE